jgi:hypothetical protein
LPLTSWRTEGSNYAGRNRASAVLSKQRGRAMRRPGSPGTANPGLTSGLPRVVQGSKKRPPQPGGATAKGRGSQEGWEFTLPGRSFTCTFRAAPLRAASLHAGRPGLGTGFQRPSFNGSNSNRALASPAFGGCSFLRDSRAERHSAVQRIPRSHFICELKKQVRLVLVLLGEGQSAISDCAGVAHGISNPNATEQGFKYRKKILVPGAAQQVPVSAGEQAARFVFRGLSALSEPAGQTRISGPS